MQPERETGVYWRAGPGLDIVACGGGGSTVCCFGGRLTDCRLGWVVADPVGVSRCPAGASGPAGSLVMMFTAGIDDDDGSVYFGLSGKPVAGDPGPAGAGDAAAGVPVGGVGAADAIAPLSIRQLAA